MPENNRMLRRLLRADGLAGVLMVAAGLNWHGCAFSQQIMPAATGASARFAISGFEVTGDSPLSVAEWSQLLAPFIGPDATLATLQKAAAALEAELKARGFALHRVSLPPQEVGARVVLHVVKFVVGKVSVEGQAQHSEANIRSSVPDLREGEVPNFGALAVQTTIANENPSKQLQVSLKESDQPDRIDARLLVKESAPWQFSASLSNTGSESTGKDRLSLVGGYANLFDLDHQLSAAYTTSVARHQDVKQLGLNYRIPLYRQGGVFGLSYTRSDVVGSFGTFSSTGAGQTLGLSYNHYLEPEGGRRSQLTLSLDRKRFDVSLVNEAPVPGQLERGSRPLTLGYSVRMETDSTAWAYNLELSANLSGGAGNTLEAYQSEDVRINSTNWKAVRGGVSYVSAAASGWSWSARTQFQYSPGALISGEQFGLGGNASVRGTAERALAGDTGVFASLEATGPAWLPGLRPIAFMDGGWLRNNNADANPNKPGNDRLLGVGLGLRYGSASYSLSAEWGRLLSGSLVPFTAGSGLPQAGDQKIHLNLTASF